MALQLIGINGGTFDPIHFGHLRPALEVMERLNLEQVRFVPCYQPVHRGQPTVSAQQRCEMIELAIAPQPRFCLDTIEIDRGGPSYMVETLAELKQRFPDKGLVLIMGSDAFAKFHTWHQWQRILELANIAVTHRPGEAVPLYCEAGQILSAHHVKRFTQPSGQIVDVPVTQLDLSSTAVRSYLQQGWPVDYLMPAKVIRYIEKHHLYRDE
ncbi:nicotinate-nucleotide adenylyltransferase [Thiomicrorhabdus sp. zzn3]|uniref:nicotinate-nucleotide adenylyltransferase n=1 Tax=Thiomicrorhabdus sp. zzn3 TaxID=3039775 RepID=UPI002436CA62|nr:nicotinate-nucleotide adenylyltransferase [Thiomicrorhabdus sp. zzn3]MDG6779096.1 nicotinate-nucleotide adenylyltransferase [Thiomicrorhabdus sp. zzn3]